jgi:hypothetical protein
MTVTETDAACRPQARQVITQSLSCFLHRTHLPANRCRWQPLRSPLMSNAAPWASTAGNKFREVARTAESPVIPSAAGDPRRPNSPIWPHSGLSCAGIWLGLFGRGCSCGDGALVCLCGQTGQSRAEKHLLKAFRLYNVSVGEPFVEIPCYSDTFPDLAARRMLGFGESTPFFWFFAAHPASPE